MDIFVHSGTDIYNIPQMRKRGKNCMKKIAIYFFIFIFICFILPALLTKRDMATSTEIESIEQSQTENSITQQNINEYDYKQYLKKFSIVFQDYKLYNLTIKENICFDCFDNIKFNETIKKCDLETIINQLDDKENTYIDKMYNNSGVNFSGGELQKIAIARAVYRKGDVYIFDEPTSSLDPLNEHDILKIYTKLTDNHLSLIISHRMSVASLCDEIIVIDGGKIIEKGTFDELIDKRGMFYKKYNMQASLYK